MASIVEYDGGLKRLEFSLTPTGRRRTLRLGRVNARTAESWRAKVEVIIGDKLANRPHDAETSKWLGGLDESMLNRMRATGLADGVGLANAALGDFLDLFFTSLTTKPGTQIAYGHVRRNLQDFFSTSKAVRAITSADADAWRAWLVQHQKLSQATVSRRTVATRTI